MKATGKTVEVSESYGRRLTEQGKADFVAERPARPNGTAGIRKGRGKAKPGDEDGAVRQNP